MISAWMINLNAMRMVFLCVCKNATTALGFFSVATLSMEVVMGSWSESLLNSMVSVDDRTLSLSSRTSWTSFLGFYRREAVWIGLSINGR